MTIPSREAGLGVPSPGAHRPPAAAARRLRSVAGPWLWAAVVLLHAAPVAGQQGDPPRSASPSADPLEELVAEALATHPEIQAALRRAEAAEARVPQAGALPDPMLSAGLTNLPLSSMDPSADGMTMLSLHLEQRLPPRGLRAALEEAARAEAEAARAEADVVRWTLATRLREAYFELLLVDEAVEVHHRTHASLEAFASAAETAFTQGLAPQADILRAQTELAAIHEHLSELRQRRSAALAEINALLGRDSRSPVEARSPPRLLELLATDPGPGFLSAALTGPELGGGFPELAVLQTRAASNRPELVLVRHRTQAARHREDAAIRDRRPGIALTGGYGVRSARSDMISLGVSVDLPLFRGRKQDQAVAEMGLERRATQLEEEATLREIRREVAEAHADLVRARERIILLEEAVIPQARATVESAEAAYRSGEGDFTTLMQVQAVLFRHEIERAHLAAEVGRDMARLERAMGTELTREDER
jgi:outer membrane protein, heavy metal efflux system